MDVPALVSLVNFGQNPLVILLRYNASRRFGQSLIIQEVSSSELDQVGTTAILSLPVERFTAPWVRRLLATTSVVIVIEPVTNEEKSESEKLCPGFQACENIEKALDYLELRLPIAASS